MKTSFASRRHAAPAAAAVAANVPLRMHGLCISALAAVAFTFAGHVHAADAVANVDVSGDLSQHQSGAFNSQSLDLGSIKSGGRGGRTDVNVAGSVNQRQSGSFNDQHLGIGDVTGTGSSRVTVLGTVTQTQSGAFNSQLLEIGSVHGSGQTNVTVGNVTQRQSGIFGDQKTRIGVSR